MGVEKNLSDALGIDHEVPPAEIRQEVIPYEEPETPINTMQDQEDDYRLARRVRSEEHTSELQSH